MESTQSQLINYLLRLEKSASDNKKDKNKKDTSTTTSDNTTGINQRRNLDKQTEKKEKPKPSTLDNIGAHVSSNKGAYGGGAAGAAIGGTLGAGLSSKNRVRNAILAALGGGALGAGAGHYLDKKSNHVKEANPFKAIARAAKNNPRLASILGIGGAGAATGLALNNSSPAEPSMYESAKASLGNAYDTTADYANRGYQAAKGHILDNPYTYGGGAAGAAIGGTLGAGLSSKNRVRNAILAALGGGALGAGAGYLLENQATAANLLAAPGKQLNKLNFNLGTMD